VPCPHASLKLRQRLGAGFRTTDAVASPIAEGHRRAGVAHEFRCPSLDQSLLAHDVATPSIRLRPQSPRPRSPVRAVRHSLCRLFPCNGNRSLTGNAVRNPTVPRERSIVALRLTAEALCGKPIASEDPCRLLAFAPPRSSSEEYRVSAARRWRSPNPH
jgi:hypothetical protein